MTDGPMPQGPGSPPSLEQILATQANDAIRRGGDPKAVTDRLGLMVQHVRDNPDYGQQAVDAITKGADPTAVTGRIWQAAQSAKAATRYDGTRAHAGVIPSALDAMTFGLAPKGVAAVDAAVDAVTGKIKPGDTFGTAYKQNLAANRAAAAQYHEAHPVIDTGAQLVGGVGGVAATGGLGAAGDAAQLGRLARFGRTVLTGAQYGIASGAGHSDALEQGRGVAGLVDDTGKGGAIGAATGVASIPVSAAAGKVIGATPLPRLITSGAQRVAAALPEGSAGQRMAQTVAGSFGRTGEANAIIARRAAMDAEAGAGPTAPAIPRRFPVAAPIRPTALGPRALPDDGNPLVIPFKPSGGAPFPPAESVRQFKPSPMALDQAGPNVEGLAEGIANRPGPGRAIIQKAVTDRQAAMRPTVADALDVASGTTRADGEKLLQQIAEEHTRAESALASSQAAVEHIADVAKAVTNDARGLRPIAPHTPASAWQAEIGAAQPNALQVLRQMSDAQGAEADRLYGVAREATRGQPVQSPTLAQIEQTPVGRLAMTWARAQKANRGSPLPTVTETRLPPMMQRMADEAKPGDLPKLLESFRATGAVQEDTREVADPETLHYAKQYLAKLARMGVHDGAQGTLATQANGALHVWGQIRNELPPVWREADDAFAGHARLMDALNAGRNLLRTQASPAGTARKALATSLDGVEQRMAAASPEEQYAFRVGARSALADYLNSANPRTVTAQLQDARSPLSRRIVMATGDREAPARLAQRLAPQPHQLLAPPPVPVAPTEAPPIPAAARAGERGVNVLRTPITPPADHPTLSLGTLRDDAATMTPDERRALLTGAAHAARGEFAGAGGSMKSPGRVFDFNSPERAEQLRYAFPSSYHADEFQNVVGAWDKAQAQAERMTGNSATARRGAEQGERELVPLASLVGRPRMVLRSLIRGLDSEYQAGSRQQVDAEIAKVLTSPDGAALVKAAQAGDYRAKLLLSLRLGVSGLGAAKAGGLFVRGADEALPK